MTAPDDRPDRDDRGTSVPETESLAPVTYLFGRSSGHPAGTAPAEGASPTSPTAAISRAFGLDALEEDDALVGDENDEDDFDAPMDDACLALEARDQAIKALGRKALSQREVERLLVRDQVPESVALEVVAELLRDGYLDDTALAQELVGRLQERKGLGRSAIAAELTKRLLTPAAISYALELIDSGDELARAREVARKRAAQLTGLDRETAARRLSGYLLRRGYSGSAVRSAVDAALPATGTVGRAGARTPRFQ